MHAPQAKDIQGNDIVKNERSWTQARPKFLENLNSIQFRFNEWILNVYTSGFRFEALVNIQFQISMPLL